MPGVWDYLTTQSWPAKAAQSLWSAAQLPGDVYAGRTNPMSDEAIGRAADLAGAVTLGAGAIPAEANTFRAGMKINSIPNVIAKPLYHGSPHVFDKFENRQGFSNRHAAEGPGTYLTDDPFNADIYRSQAGTPSLWLNNNVAVKPDNNWFDSFVSSHVAGDDFNTSYSLSRLDEANKERAKKVIQEHKTNPLTRVTEDGRIYEVKPDASIDELIKFDTAFKDQNPDIMNAVQKVFRLKEAPVDKKMSAWGLGEDPSQFMRFPTEGMAKRLDKMGVKGTVDTNTGVYTIFNPDRLEIQNTFRHIPGNNIDPNRLPDNSEDWGSYINRILSGSAL